MMRTLSPCLTSPVGRFLLISACSCLNVFFRPFFAALASFRPSFTAAFLAFFSSGVSPFHESHATCNEPEAPRDNNNSSSDNKNRPSRERSREYGAAEAGTG